MKQDWNSRFRKYNFYDICLSKNYLLVCVLLTTAKKLSPSLCNWRNLVVCWGVNQLHYAFFVSLERNFSSCSPFLHLLDMRKKRGISSTLRRLAKAVADFFVSLFLRVRTTKHHHHENEETTKKENKTMIIVGQLICIFAKTVDMAMHFSVKKLVRKWKVLLKRWNNVEKKQFLRKKFKKVLMIFQFIFCANIQIQNVVN